MSVNIKSPSSYFFTELSFNQGAGNKAFGELNTNEFQVTTTFGGNLKAYAVTDGILFFARHGTSDDKVNILLKPTTDIGLGVKIKYFVYRGIKVSDIFKKINGFLQINDPNILSFLQPVWDSYTEFNQTNNDFLATKIGYLDVSSGTPEEILKKFFSRENYNLLYVNGGTHIGNFVDGAGGFEIVLDEGDFSQSKPDSGLEFDLKFATATSCILKSDGPHNSSLNIFGGKENANIQVKIFRENIFKFIDPAAFYGSHVTDNKVSGTTSYNRGSICLGGTTTFYSAMNDVYTQFVKKFNNKFKSYLYIKGVNNRNINFYDATNTAIINNSSIDLNTLNWPVVITSPTSQCIIEFTNSNLNDSYSSSTFISALSLLSIPDKSYLFSKVTGKYLLNLPFANDSGSNKVFSSFTYLLYNNSTINKSDYLFGPVNLSTIFEKEDYSSKQGSVINHLRPILIREGSDLGFYNSKIVLEGYIAETNPANIPTDPIILAQTLRTYIVMPQEANIELSDFSGGTLNSGYYSKIDNTEDYCLKIFGKGEIWRGKIYDGGDINTLLYKRGINDDINLGIYQLGISQLDYKKLTDDVYLIDPEATNLLFCFENQYNSPDGVFLKYDLKIKFDKVDGTRGKTNVHIDTYTIDNCFYFTKEYSSNFKYFKEFADTTVEFRPHQDWDGEFGIDWYRKGQNTWPGDPFGNKIYDRGFAGNVGAIPTQSDGNDYTGTFVADYNMLNELKRKEYNLYPTNWHLSSDNETECLTSWLSINKGDTIKLNLRIRVKNEAIKLRIKYPNKYFKIKNTDVSNGDFNFYDFPATEKAVTTTARFFDLEITCIEEFASTEILEVRADDKLAGMLKVIPNKKNIIGDKQNFLFVNVKFKLPDGNIYEYPSAELSSQKGYLEKFIKQSQIIPNIEMTSVSLDLTGDKYFNKVYTGSPSGTGGEGYYAYTNPSYIPGIPTEPKYMVRAYFSSHAQEPGDFIEIKSYLRSKLLSVHPEYNNSKYKNYIFIFFLYAKGGEETLTSFKNINGYSSGAQTDIAVFRLDLSGGSWTGYIDETLSHEAYHSLGIPHAFDKLDVNSKFVYKYAQTDNLLDYTHNNSKNRRSLYHWQWKIAKKNIKK